MILKFVPILSLLKNDLHTIFTSIIHQKLKDIQIEFEDKVSLCRYIVPKNYAIGKTNKSEIIIPNIINNDYESIFYGDIHFKNNKYFTNTSRTLCIFNKSLGMENAYKDNTQIIKLIKGTFHYRTDIGVEFNYKNSGVDIDNYESILHSIKNNITSTYNKNVQCGFGGFGGVYKINETQSIIQSIDGIGTKSLLSFR